MLGTLEYKPNYSVLKCFSRQFDFLRENILVLLKGHMDIYVQLRACFQPCHLCVQKY